MGNMRTPIWIVGAGIMLLLMVWLHTNLRRPAQNSSPAPIITTETGDSAILPPAPLVSTISPGTLFIKPKPVPVPAIVTSPSPTLSYGDALKKYEGFRFQFVNCLAKPYWMSLPKGHAFMLDNRDQKTHTIEVGSQKFTIPKESYVIATATAVGASKITCDGRLTASLNVEL